MYQTLCQLEQLIPNVGASVLINNEAVALFYIPQQGVYAIQDWDPIGKAFVLTRGIVGDIKGELCVASPLYKQHFSLQTGRCIEDEAVQLRIWPVQLKNTEVCIKLE